jgi:D-xylose transport system substrate-binding protein
MFRVRTRLIVAAVLGVSLVGGLFAAASSSAKPATTAAAKVTWKNLTAADFNRDFGAMYALKPLAKLGKGSVDAILPDTTSSARYTEFDAPYLDDAFKDAGLKSSQYTVQNGMGSDSTFVTDAEADITNGASVLLIDPEDSGTGTTVEDYAKAHGVKVIDYDRLTLGGSRAYYVSFNNVNVGTLLGKGLVSCVAAWKTTNSSLSSPKVIVMHGATTDNNATLFAQGYDAVLKPYFSSKGWTDVFNTAGTWDPPTAETEFQQAFTANSGVNAALIPNDETGAPIISYLQSEGVKPYTFPVTGQDATLVGLQNVISGYQCGTVYKPIYLEAQAAGALAMYLRAGKTPPKGLVNGSVEDTSENVPVPSILETPEWVTPTNMEKTVILDRFVTAAQLCAGSYAADCTKYKIH